jgi:hypothetical protein
MKPLLITAEYEAVASWLRNQVVPWRRMTIAIDGVDHAGKSSLSRFLAWQLGMPAIESDFALKPDSPSPAHNADLLGRLIRHRHELDRPALVEGVFVLRALHELQIDPEIVVGVRAKGRTGSHVWQSAFRRYRIEFPRAKLPDYMFKWSPKNDA